MTPDERHAAYIAAGAQQVEIPQQGGIDIAYKWPAGALTNLDADGDAICASLLVAKVRKQHLTPVVSSVATDEQRIAAAMPVLKEAK